MLRDQLETFLHDYLNADDFTDLCPNGLQVNGTEKISKIITGVSASVALFEKAISENADAIIVHHGIIWNFERPLYKGGYRERVKLLLTNNINLFAYHLPLDAHPQIGNNIRLCNALQLQETKPFGNDKGQYIGMQGTRTPITSHAFFDQLKNIVERDLTIFPYGPKKISSVGIISGGAQKHITQAVAEGLDVFITGEVSEHIMHYAREEQIHFISAGHYATEKFGIIALGDLIAEKFDIEVKFIDIPNPV